MNDVITQIKTEEVDVPVPWGVIKTQIFGETDKKPLIGLSGYLDNSNSLKPISYYLNKGGYYVISIDYPGHGFSSHLPPGIPTTPYTLLMCIRRVIRHFGLKKFSLLTHSFGTFICLMYSITYPDEIDKVVGLDSMVIIDITEGAKNNIPYYWNQTIDEFLNSENTVEKPIKNLTKEKALKVLLHQAPHLDEQSALLLLERGLRVENNSIKFSRDKRLKIYMLMSDIIILGQQLQEHFKSPFLLVYSYPRYMAERGEKIQDYLVSILKSSKNKKYVEAIRFDGEHHFHMTEPEKAANIVLNFLNNENLALNAKL